MPRDPCGTCGKSAAKDSIVCIFCGLWHHANPNCMVGFSKENVEMLKTICKEQSCWTCQKCGIIIKKLNGKLTELTKCVNALKKDVVDVQSKQETTSTEVEPLKKEVQSIGNKVQNTTVNARSSCMSESEDRERRKNNLIILGLDEPVTEDEENAESLKSNEDLAVDNTLASMNLDPATVKPFIKYRKRLGRRQSGKIRPSLLSFDDPVKRNAVMEKSSTITGKVKLKPDLTKDQRQSDIKVIEEVVKLNKRKPCDDQGDFRWRVRWGHPGC